MRPDGVLYWTPNVVTDVRTCNPTDHMPRSCSEPGIAASKAENEKTTKWGDICAAQGDRFVPLAFEAGGRIGLAALDLINEITHSSGGTPGELSFLTAWALQRLHSVNSAGVAALILSRTPVLKGPGLLRSRGHVSYAPPPAGKVTTPCRSLLPRTFRRPEWTSNLLRRPTCPVALGAPLIGFGADAPFSGIAVSNPSCPAPSLIRPASRHAPLSQTILPSSSLSSSSSTPSLFSASSSNPSSSQISPLSFSSLHPSQTHNPNPPIPDIPQLSQTPDVTAGLPGGSDFP